GRASLRQHVRPSRSVCSGYVRVLPRLRSVRSLRPSSSAGVIARCSMIAPRTRYSATTSAGFQADMTVVVDTSALTALIFGEPEASAFASVLATHANDVAVSAATLVECEIVLGARHGPNAVQDLSLLLAKVGADVVAFDQEQAALAGTAWRRFGK